MNQELLSLFENLDRNKNEILAKVLECTSEELFHKPSEKEWSLAQVFDHLFIAEYGTLKYIQKKIQGLSELSEVNSANALSFQKLNEALQSDNKYKLPDTMSDPKNQELSLTLSAWAKIREELRKLYTALPESSKRKAIFKHPYAGYLTPAQTLSFLSDHISHHKLQIDNLIKKV